eukprot:869601-Karenia_brevis.AAC.1
MNFALTTPRGSPWIAPLVLLKWVKGGFCPGGRNPTHSSGAHLEVIWGSCGVIWRSSDGQRGFIWAHVGSSGIIRRSSVAHLGVIWTSSEGHLGVSDA